MIIGWVVDFFLRKDVLKVFKDLKDPNDFK